MEKRILILMEFLSRQSFRFNVAGGAVLALLVGVPDYCIGREFFRLIAQNITQAPWRNSRVVTYSIGVVNLSKQRRKTSSFRAGI